MVAAAVLDATLFERRPRGSRQQATVDRQL